MNRRLGIVLLANVLLLWLVELIHFGLTRYQVTLLLPGLLLAFPALNFKPFPAVLAGALTGLWMDTASPAPFGLHTILFGFSIGIILQFRHRLHRENRTHGFILTHVLNLILGVVLAIFLGRGFYFDPAYWIRIAVDLLASHLILLLITPWFFQLQISALDLVGVQIFQDEIESESA